LGGLPNSGTEELAADQEVALSIRYEVRIDVGEAHAHSLLPSIGLWPLRLLPPAACLPSPSDAGTRTEHPVFTIRRTKSPRTVILNERVSRIVTDRSANLDARFPV
jgi:hypothetical protein